MERVRANQNAERAVRTRPFAGMSVGSTTSKVEIRSEATSSSRSSSSAYSSRTFPLPRCTASAIERTLPGSLLQLRHPPRPILRAMSGYLRGGVQPLGHVGERQRGAGRLGRFLDQVQVL